MPRLTLAVRIAAGSIFILSLLHTILWLALAISLRSDPALELPYRFLRFLFVTFSLAGVAGALIAIELFRARNSARIAALVLGALVAVFCALGMLVAIGLLFTAGSSVELYVHRSDFLLAFLVYLVALSTALWWIILFSRKSVAAQFSSNANSVASPALKKPSCPPPIALLAWLMILTSVLCVLSWPVILSRIPAMLFTHVFSLETSKWIWAANILLFLFCGIGLLKLQRWSYTGTIALHSFWLVSPFVSQVSPRFPQYLGNCYAALQADQAATYFIHFNIPPLFSALVTAIPTTLLIAGLFYYRRAFLKTVQDSHHLSS